MRLLISAIVAIGVSLGIFIGMEKMTSSKGIKKAEHTEQIELVFLRDKKETKVNEKKRVKPKKPEENKPKKVDFKKPKMETKIEKDVKIQPLVNQKIDLSSISQLNGAKINVDVGVIDANTLMTISRVYPKYPRRAKFKEKKVLFSYSLK